MWRPVLGRHLVLSRSCFTTWSLFIWRDDSSRHGERIVHHHAPAPKQCGWICYYPQTTSRFTKWSPYITFRSVSLSKGAVKQLPLHDTSTTETVPESVICRVSCSMRRGHVSLPCHPFLTRISWNTIPFYGVTFCYSITHARNERFVLPFAKGCVKHAYLLLYNTHSKLHTETQKTESRTSNVRLRLFEFSVNIRNCVAGIPKKL